MALILADRVKVRTRTTGTGSFLIENTFTGFQGFDAIGDGNETYYAVFDSSGNWEVGRGTYTALSTTLTRDNVIDSSSGSKVDFPAGGKTLYVTFPSTVLNSVATGLTDSFKNIQVSGQSSVVADGPTDTLTLIAGSQVAITTDSLNDTITISTTIPNTAGNNGKYLSTDGSNLIWEDPPASFGGGGGEGGIYYDFNIAADDSSQKTIFAGETVKFIGATGISTSSDAEGNITITGPDLSSYATTSSLSSYATVASLSDYATTASLSSYATVSSLSDYATTASLSSYATTASLSTVATSNDYNDLDNLPTIVPSRTTKIGVTTTIADDANEDVNITGFKGYILYKIQTSAAAWVRIYTDAASRTADASRNELTDPDPGSGVIAEVITTGAQTILISPGTFGYNNESSPTTNIPINVTNKSGGSAAITVTLTVLQVEA
jgi:hypothetical protein